MSRAASLAVRAMGPETEMPPQSVSGYWATRPKVGFRPTSPQKLDGVRIEPPVSVPILSGPSPDATAAPLPPLLPPVVRLVSHGLTVTPVSGLSVIPELPNSGVVTLPSRTAPDSRSRATAGSSSLQGP